MGVCCSKPGEELPAATQADIDILKEKGHLPCCGIPKVDAEGKNNLHTVYVAEYENGTELTFLFLDEDRPNKCEDCLYDTIRRPLFGRKSGNKKWSLVRVFSVQNFLYLISNQHTLALLYPIRY